MAETKTDNSYLMDKIMLRANHLPDGDVIVLDCFAGSGKIWNGVTEVANRKIRRLPIDFKDEFGFHLPGDNMAYLPYINFDKFNVIDLDAYGIPYKQLKVIFDRAYKGYVFITFIQSLYGAIPHGLLNDIGIPEEMIKKIPTLFYRSGFDYFLEWLALHGVTRIAVRNHKRKWYLFFSCAEECASGYNTPREGIFEDRA